MKNVSCRLLSMSKQPTECNSSLHSMVWGSSIPEMINSSPLETIDSGVNTCTHTILEVLKYDRNQEGICAGAGFRTPGDSVFKHALYQLS